MTIRDAVAYGCQQLEGNSGETPRLDSILLLCEVLAVTKEVLLSSYPEKLEDDVWLLFKDLLDKRAKGTPVAYIRKRKEFFGLDFFVDPRVLIPRPDTEILVETAVDILVRNRHLKSIHDLCTGSGCIAVAIKHELPDLFVSASDISVDALDVFKFNSRNILGEEIPGYQSDLLNDVPGDFDMIVANPPYLSLKEVSAMKGQGWPEPSIALLGGGAGGSEILFQLVRQCADRLKQGGYLLLEGASVQLSSVKKIMNENGFLDIIIKEDLAGRERIVAGRKK